ncbi:MAG: ABC transporter ATP-binding protein [Pseudomonadota bacterium]|nr:ABC transporter ATP-binding protein [Pseudomonadota bacterium]
MSEKEKFTGAQARATGVRLIKEAMPSRWRLYLVSLVCMIGVAGFTGALANSTRMIVNDVFVADDTSAAIHVALIVIAVSIGKSFFEYANAVISTIFNRSISADYQKKVFERMLSKDVWHFSGKHASVQMNQVRVYGQACGKTVINFTNKLLTDALTLVGLIVVMIIQDPLMTLLSSVMFPLIFWLVSHLSKKVRAVANAETELSGAYFATGVEAFDGIKTLKSYRLEKKTIKKFEEGVEALEERMLGIAKVTSATVPIMELLGGLVIGFFVVYAAWQTITNGKTPGEFTAFITAFLMAYQPAERVSKTWVELQKSITHVGRMYRELESPVKQRDEGRLTLSSTAPSIAFEDVSFEYSSKSRALHRLNFNINAGERVAIVGRSGAGKSTLIDLVLRFYDPTSGVVRIGGLDMKDVTEQSARDSIALISQDVFLFDGTIRDNLRDGNPDASDEDLERAARLAQLSDLIDRLPEGLDSRVGPNGSALSGGQKQRVGIARALAKGAKIYIFDEATSALDVENEQAIMKMLQKELASATILFVTHRPSTLTFVDRILMLDNGELIGFDTAKNLEESKAQYRALFNLPN